MSKTGESLARIDVVMSGYFNPIRFEAQEEYNRRAPMEIASIAEMYCGAVKTPENMRVFVQCSKDFKSKFSKLGYCEIPEAFSMAAAKLIDVDLTAYAGRFTVAMFGGVMAAYVEYRDKLLNTIQSGQTELENVARDAEVKIKSAELAAHVKKEFESLIFNNTRFESMEQIPGFWPRILVDAGLLESDAAAWVESKIAVCNDFAAKAGVGESDIVIGDSHACRKLADKIKSDPDFFPSELMERAKVLYGRTLIWNAIGPFVGQ